MADPDFNNIRQTPEYQQLIITTYEQLVYIDPNDINAHLSLAKIHHQQGKHDDAFVTNGKAN